MTQKIVISIINYRTAELTLQCIRSVLDDLGDVDGHIVVVDNNSGDGSADEIATWIAAQDKSVAVTLVRSITNDGFSDGHNQGMAAVDAEYYLLLNSDTLVHPGFFENLLAAADAQSNAGLIAPKLQGEDGVTQSSCFRFHTPFSELIRSANSAPISSLFRKYKVSLGPEPDIDRIQWASFACILLRASMVRDIGPMDDGYFLYFEDAEYCLRAHRAGWPVHYAPQAVAVHFRGGSGPVKSLTAAKKRLPDYYYNSRTRFFRQAHGWGGLVLANIMWFTGRAVAQLRRLAGKRVTPMAEREMRDIWINFTTPLSPYRAPGDLQ